MFTRQRSGRTQLLLTAIAAVAAVWLLGCSGETIGEALAPVGEGSGNNNGSGSGNGGGGGNTTPSHTHTWGDWVVTTPATCDISGVETRTCTQDASHTETRAISELDCSVDPNIVVKGTFIDNRNSQTYKTVKIGSQTWMAENLNYQTSNSWCYSDKADSCAKYGRLYKWEAARSACPSGWHLPSRAEWDKLNDAAGGSSTAGKKLKSTSGWNYSSGISSTDEFSFSALPGGSRHTDGNFFNAGIYGYWWTATETSSGFPYNRRMYYSSGSVSEGSSDKSFGVSVRCLEDG